QASPMPLPSVSVWLALPTVGQLSQTSPLVSVSRSAWVWLVTVGQLSQASPSVSASAFAWLALATVGQLSFCPVFGGLNPTPAQMPSLSTSLSASPGQASQTSPDPSPSAFAWLALATVGQLSFCPVFGGLKPAPAQIPSLSGSFSASPGQGSHASPRAWPP